MAKKDNMTLNEAIRVLMQAAERDVTGMGMGYRVTTDQWRKQVSEAWVVAFRRAYKREPDDSDYWNRHMPKPER